MLLEAAPRDKQGVLADASLATPLAELVRPAPRLQYLHSYSYFFAQPNWLHNLLLLAVALVIPIVGPMVLAGYQFEVIAALHRAPRQPYPDFDFNRCGDYLSRGIWKFLVDMLLQFVMMPVYLVLYVVSLVAIFGIGAAFSTNQNNPGPAMGIAAAIVVPLAMAVALVVMAVLQIVAMPLVFKASLSGEPSALFDFRFLGGFLRRTWRETLLEMVWLGVTTPVVVVLGLALCFVGVYPAFALVQMADAHTTWQLYEIYLARDGEPIRPKINKPAPVIAVPIDEPLEVEGSGIRQNSAALEEGGTLASSATPKFKC